MRPCRRPRPTDRARRRGRSPGAPGRVRVRWLGGVLASSRASVAARAVTTPRSAPWRPACRPAAHHQRERLDRVLDRSCRSSHPRSGTARAPPLRPPPGAAAASSGVGQVGRERPRRCRPPGRRLPRRRGVVRSTASSPTPTAIVTGPSFAGTTRVSPDLAGESERLHRRPVQPELAGHRLRTDRPRGRRHRRISGRNGRSR